MTTQSLESLPLTRLKGVGPSLERKFSRLGIRNIEDLLFHLPLRYEDRTHITAIRHARLGAVSYTHLTLPTILLV